MAGATVKLNEDICGTIPDEIEDSKWYDVTCT